MIGGNIVFVDFYGFVVGKIGMINIGGLIIVMLILVIFENVLNYVG